MCSTGDMHCNFYLYTSYVTLENQTVFTVTIIVPCCQLINSNVTWDKSYQLHNRNVISERDYTTIVASKVHNLKNQKQSAAFHRLNCFFSLKMETLVCTVHQCHLYGDWWQYWWLSHVTWRIHNIKYWSKALCRVIGRRRSDLKQHQLILDVGSHFLNWTV